MCVAARDGWRCLGIMVHGSSGRTAPTATASSDPQEQHRRIRQQDKIPKLLAYVHAMQTREPSRSLAISCPCGGEAAGIICLSADFDALKEHGLRLACLHADPIRATGFEPALAVGP